MQSRTLSTTQNQTQGPSARRSALPVTVIAMPVRAVRPETSLSMLMTGLANFSVLPVVDRRKRLVGVVREQDVLVSPDLQLLNLQEGLFEAGSVLINLKETDTVDRAIRLFGECDQPLIPILDKKGRYSGQCASRRMLFQLLHGELRPARIGGMATPLGVFMTTGVYMSGSGWKGLVATGVMFGLLAYPLSWLELVVYSALVSFLPGFPALTEGNQLVLQQGLFLVLTLSLLRLSPMAGLHAAEHMTINAIENGLEITEPMVRTQPREHWRCGTNFMVLMGGLSVFALSAALFYDQVSPLGLGLYAMLWFGVILKYWRPMGLWLQRHFTTKDPTPAQLESGLRAGREILARFSEHPHPIPSIAARLWGSGLAHMILSFMATLWLVTWLLERLRI